MPESDAPSIPITTVKKIGVTGPYHADVNWTKTIDGLKARFPVTRAGIIAAAHRQGTPATARYLNKIKANGFTSRGLYLDRSERATETRLRTFRGRAMNKLLIVIVGWFSILACVFAVVRASGWCLTEES